MVKLVRTIDNFEDLKEIFYNCGYTDDVIEHTEQYAQTHDNMKDLYDDVLNSVTHYMYMNVPSYYNTSYPHCISTSIGPYGFSYMKDGLGMGIATKLNRKTGDVTFTITFYFNKDKNFMRHNDCFNWCLEHEFDLIEIDNKKKKK